MKANFNDTITVYPNKKGWKKIKEISLLLYCGNKMNTNFFIAIHTTEDGGFVQPIWQFIHLFSGMIYHGTSYFENMNFKIK